MLPKVTMKSGLKLPKKHQKHGVYVPMWTKSHQDVLLGSTIYTTLYKVSQETLFFSNPHFFFLIVFFNESTVDLQCYFLVHSKVSDSVTHTHTHTHTHIYIYSFSYSFPLWFLTGYLVQCYTRALLFSVFFILIPSIQTVKNK